MTLLFALLAACGAAGLAFSMLGQHGAPAGASFSEALNEAEGPGPDLASRLERLEEKVRALESAAAKTGAAGAPAEASLQAIERESGSRQAACRRPAAGSLSGRMKAVWEASDRDRGPLEIARELKMGVSEVELALKMRKMRPARG